MRLLVRDGWIDVDGGVVARAEPTRLGDAERALLALLGERAGEVVDREELLAATGTPTSNALDRLVSRVRHKVEVEPKEPAHLLTAYGAGYKWVPPTDLVRAARPSSARLIGRGDHQLRLLALAGSHPVVTVVGPGGVGKTSLVRDTFPEWTFVDLAGAQEPDEVGRLTGAALGGPRGDSGSVVGRLRERPRSLILDNAEHIPEIVADRVDRWRAAAPATRFLITSRAPTGAVGEVTFSLDPLGEEDAIALLLRRGALAGRAWADGPAARQLVRHLEGLPLAIEIAAASVSGSDIPDSEAGFDPAWLDAQVVRWRDLPERHSSLARAVAWSWDLLGEEERAALVAFAPIRGPVPLAVVEGLAGERGLDVLHALVLQGLIQVDRDQLLVRPLEVVCRFAAEQAAEAPWLERVRRRQIAFATAWISPECAPWAVAAAAGVALAVGGADGAELAVGLLATTLASRKRLALADLVLRAHPDPACRARAWRHRTRALRYTGHDQEAREAAWQAVLLAPHHELAAALLELAHADRQLGRFDEAEAGYLRALDLGRPEDRAAVLHGLGELGWYRCRPLQAATWRLQAAEAFDAMGRHHMADGCRIGALLGGDVGASALVDLERIEAGMVARRAPPDRMAFVASWRGLLRARLGDPAGALADFNRSSQVLRDLDYDVPWVEVQGFRAWTLAALGRADEAFAVLDTAARRQRGYLAGLVALWRGLVSAAVRDPQAPVHLAEARASLDPQPGSLHALWLGLGHALLEGREREYRAACHTPPDYPGILLPPAWGRR